MRENNDIREYYEYQKSIITAKKNLNTNFQNRTEELNNIKKSLYMERPQYKEERVIAKPQFKTVQRPIQNIPTTQTYSNISVTSQQKVTNPSKEKKAKSKASKTLFQRIKSLFSRGKSAISNFFSEPDKSAKTLDSRAPSSINNNFVSPKLINDTSKTKKQNTYSVPSQLDYLRYNNNISNHSGADRVSKINGVSSSSISSKNPSYRDSLSLARYLEEEKRHKSLNSSSHIDSLEFAKYLRTEKNTNHGLNSSGRYNREIEER